MTATQPDSDATATQAKSGGLTRRGVMRRAGIGATTAVGIGASASRLGAGPVGSASAVAPLVAAGILGAGVGAAAGVVAYGALFEDDNAEELDSAQEYEAHLNLYNRAQESRLQLDETLASLQRDVQLVQNKAREEAIFRVWEAGVDGLDEAAATDAAEDAIQDSFATVQESILTSWTIRHNRYNSLIGTDLVPDASEEVLMTTSPDGSATRQVGGSGQYFGGSNGEVLSRSLVDGTTLDVPSHYVEGDSDPDTTYTQFDPVERYVSETPDSDNLTQVRVTVPDADNYTAVDEDTHDHTSPVVAFDAEPWSRTYDDLMDEFDNMMAEVSSMVDTYFQPAQDGEIDLSTMRGPAHLSNTAENAEDFEEAALALRAMGYKLADQPSILEFEVDGETVEAEGRLARTMNDPDPLPAGSQIDPDLTAGSIYFAYNNRDENGELIGGEVTELRDPFVVAEADGGEVNFETRTLAESDHNLTAEEIAEIFEQNRQADDDAREVVHEIAVGGAGGILGFDDGIPTIGLVAGGAALVALLFGNN